MASSEDGHNGVDRASIVGERLLPTLWESPVRDFAVDSGDQLFHKLMDGGALDSVPVIKYLVGAGKTVNAVSDYILARKVVCFLFETSRRATRSASRFREKLEGDPTYQKRVGTAVIAQLERLDDTVKAEIVGRLFALVVDDEIGYSNYRRAAHSIDRCFTDYLLDLPRLPEDVVLAENDGFEPDVLENLYASGLLLNVGFDGGDASDTGPRGTRYVANETARLIARVLEDH